MFNKKINVKELYSLEPGKVYWIVVGDEKHPANINELFEVRQQMDFVTKETGIKFIVANHKLKPVEKLSQSGRDKTLEESND